MNITKFEAFGIGASVLLMVVALYLMRVDNGLLGDNEANSAISQQAAVYVVADGDDQAAIANAVIEASDGKGALNAMVIDDVVLGDGATVEKGDTVNVHYIGTLQNGQEFDNSYKKGEPFSFTVGEGRVIAGWEQGIVGMQEGGQRILVIPSHLAYGKEGYGPIPGGAALVFAIELLSIE